MSKTRFRGLLLERLMIKNRHNLVQHLTKMSKWWCSIWSRCWEKQCDMNVSKARHGVEKLKWFTTISFCRSKVLIDHFWKRLLYPISDCEAVHVEVVAVVAGVEQQVLYPRHVESREGVLEITTKGGGRGRCRAGGKLRLRGLAGKVGGEIPHNSWLLAGERHGRAHAVLVHVVLPLLVQGGEWRLRDRRVKHRNEVEVDPLLAEVTDGSKRVRGEGLRFQG